MFQDFTESFEHSTKIFLKTGKTGIDEPFGNKVFSATKKFTIAIHGGAGTISPDHDATKETAYAKALQAVLTAGYKVFGSTGSSFGGSYSCGTGIGEHFV